MVRLCLDLVRFGLCFWFAFVWGDFVCGGFVCSAPLALATRLHVISDYTLIRLLYNLIRLDA